MIRVDATSLDDAQFEKIKPVNWEIPMGQTGRSGYIHGSPAGMVHSSSYGSFPI